ncbi:hypothetical protein VKT23_015509 [Stygiomarasmius scandens]|uniref:Xylanolytic transcriptional activator regulatory domain-containing protein n=1 Tax=Marasmiellus scandens TaxID=2682957 RepID=A0ABR1IZP0_9AGAR
MQFISDKFNTQHFYPPIQPLLNTIYLWGAHLSDTTYLPATMNVFLSRALQSVSLSLCHHDSKDHPQKTVQTIQAEVLLANYFICNARLLEGRYHLSTASSLALSCGLHKSGSETARQGSIAGLGDSITIASGVEREETIHAMWTVLALNNIWMAVDSLPSNIAYTTDGVKVDTPWPVDFETIGNQSNTTFTGSNTIQNFLMGTQDGATSYRALYAKCSILFEQATMVGIRYKEGDILLYTAWIKDSHKSFHLGQSAELQRSFLALDALTSRFISSLPPIETVRNQTDSLVHSTRDLLCIHTLAYSARMRLYLPFAYSDEISYNQAMQCARSIIEAIHLIDLDTNNQADYVDPILGVSNVFGYISQIS